MCDRKCLLFIILTALLLCSSGCNDPGGDNTVSSVRVTYVIDGDTVILSGGERMRYIGIDAPEVRRKEASDWVYAPEPFAEAAKTLNSALLESGKFRLEFDLRKKDRYGRVLGYLFTDEGRFVNKLLLQSGMATVYTFPPNVLYRDIFVAAQEAAIQNQRGFWENLLEVSPFEDEVGRGSVLKITGKIEDTLITGGSLYLFFDRKREAIALRIPVGNLRFFLEKGIDPAVDYIGQAIEVIGRLEKKRYRQIYVDGPFQISIKHSDSAPVE